MPFSQQGTYDHAAYTIALICPLEVEMSAARYMLDDEHPQLPPAPHDTNRYIFGQLSGHNVVIASLPEGLQGVASAAAVAIHTLRTFPSITMSLLLGIGGGVPSDQNDIRLGDVVVSAPTGTQGGVVEYDLGKLTATGFVRKGYLAPPAKEWLNMIKIMRSDHRARPNKVSEYLSQMTTKFPRLKATYQRPSSRKDRLFRSDYVHPSGEKSCQHCDEYKLIKRSNRDYPDEPVVHYGLIASGNRVIKDGVHRDLLSDEVGGAICFEMEAAGMMNDFQAVVLRGISDYADSHKNDQWHAYAAAAAAGVAKELLSYAAPASSFESVMHPSKTAYENAHFMVPRKVNSNFIGRSSLLEQIAMSLYPKDYDNLLELLGYPQIFVLTGIGGVGKSEICLKVASMMRDKFWAVFWVDVDDMVSATRHFAMISDQLGLQDSSILSARNALANLKTPWLLILDNADDPDQDLNSYIPPGSMGSILITSRVPEARSYATVGHNALDGLPEDEALHLFSQSSGLDLNNKQYERNVRDAWDLVINLLNCHTLAIIQAGAYIRLGYSTLRNYVDLFHRSGHDEEVARRQMRALKHRSVQERSRYESVYKTFEISVSFLERESREEDTDAICLLNLLACLSHTSLSAEIFQAAWEGYEHHQRDLGYSRSSDTEIWEYLSYWHCQQLPPFVAVSTRTWDPFRLQSAINKLYSLALLNRTHDGNEEHEVLSSHPLVHSWARVRQQKSVRNESWVRAGSLIAHAWKRHSYRLFESQIPAHIESFVAYGLEDSSDFGPDAEIAVILLRCASFLWRGGHYMPMENLVTEMFSRHQGNPYLPTKKLLHFHLLDIEFRAERYGPLVTIKILRKIVTLLRNRAPDDATFLDAQAHLACALYSCLSQEALSIMVEVVAIASQHRSVWDQDLFLWQINLAGLYADDCQFDKAIDLLRKLRTIQRQSIERGESLGITMHRTTSLDPYTEVKQLLRAIVVKKKWQGEDVTLPIDDQLQEERYRNHIWAGKHTSSSSAIEMWSESMMQSMGMTKPLRMELHNHLKTGAFGDAIQHLKLVKAHAPAMPSSKLTLFPGMHLETSQLPGMSDRTQSDGSQEAQQTFLRDFNFPTRGTDLELDQLRAQHLALEYPAAEIFALNQRDPSFKAQHPYFKYSSREKAKFVMEGRWDLLECPKDLLGPNNQRPYGLVILDPSLESDQDARYVYFRRQLYNLSRRPDWW